MGRPLRIEFAGAHYHVTSRGNLTGRIDANNRTILYAYDNLNRLTQVTLPDSQTIAYAYDTGNRLSTLTGSEAGVFTFGYDTKDRRSSLAFPNGITASYTFDNGDRLTGLIHSAQSGDVLSIAYPQLDNLGNRIQRTEDGQTTTYGYDELYRLLNAADTQGTETFTYDAVGNRLSGPTVKDTPANAYDYNDTHQMIQGRKFDYTYDNNGNQIVRALKNGKGWIQEWDAQNRLTKVERTNGADSRTVTFKYDPFGRRIEKKVVDVFSGATAVTTTTYVYDAEDIVLEIEAIEANGVTTTTETRFIHGPGIDEPLAMVRNGQNYFYHADGLGSIVAITDQNQNIVQKYSYKTFGLPTPTDPSFRQPYAFTAREWDYETGLYFYRARYYDPMEGRFISKDPIGFAGGDVLLYGYVGSNSANKIDPLGLCDDCPNGVWEIDRGGSTGVAILVGANRTRVTFTCKSTGKKCSGVIDCGVIGAILDVNLFSWSVDPPKPIGKGNEIKGCHSNYDIENYFADGISISPGVSGVTGVSTSNISIGIGIGAGVAYQQCVARSIVCESD